MATPHFALPFRWERGSVVTNEQHSLDDVADCVEAVLRTRPGDRAEAPDFGIDDPTFDQLPLDLDALVGQVSAQEPRAHLLAEERPDLLDEAVTRARITASTQE